MELSAKRVVVVGLGKSGIAAARLCKRLGAHVVGTDNRPESELGEALRDLDIELALGGHAGVAFESADLVVVSPGVPALPELARAEAAGVEVIGELELAYRQLLPERPGRPVVAIGGTNGKSTTTTLIGALLRSAGWDVFVGGNLGTPACDAVGGDFDVIVLEVSSFQLERAPQFRPAVSVLLNITDDHLDRYASFAEYARAKGNAFVNQSPADSAIYPRGDVICEAQVRRGHGRRITFGAGGDYFARGRELVEGSSGHAFSLERVNLHGAHNLDNAAAALAAARALGVMPQAISAGLEAFEPLPHRMAWIAEIGGVNYYDDSKATNVGAAVTALLGSSEPQAVLIAGGRDKLGAYDPLVAALQKKGRAVVVIGEAADRIASAIGDSVPIARATTMNEAVERAALLAEPGDAVLLSPACSSFDMFQSYADRGDQFARAVRALEAARRTP